MRDRIEESFVCKLQCPFMPRTKLKQILSVNSRFSSMEFQAKTPEDEDSSLDLKQVEINSHR